MLMSSGKQDSASQGKKTEFLQIRISPDKKREIEKFLEERGFRSISSFVLFCIDYYMNFGEKIDKILQLLEDLEKTRNEEKKEERQEEK